MLDADVVLAKVASVERCLRRIREVTRLEPERLDDQDVQDIFVLNVERAAQACIDLASHVVASEGLGLPASMAESFTLLESHGFLDPDLARRLRGMVGFRNLAVHDYTALDPNVLRAILTRHLDDFTAFCGVVAGRLEP